MAGVPLDIRSKEISRPIAENAAFITPLASVCMTKPSQNAAMQARKKLRRMDAGDQRFDA
jgi:hypothetical protein